MVMCVVISSTQTFRMATFNMIAKKKMQFSLENSHFDIIEVEKQFTFFQHRIQSKCLHRMLWLENFLRFGVTEKY